MSGSLTTIIGLAAKATSVTAEGANTYSRDYVGEPGAWVSQVREPLDLGWHVSQAVELGAIFSYDPKFR